MKRIKQDLINLTLKEGISYVFAIVAFVFGIILSTWGFVTPPPGEISNSVLFLVGQLLLFIASLLGISYAYEGKLSNFEREMRSQINKNNRQYEDEEDNIE